MLPRDCRTWSLDDTELPGESGGQMNESSDCVLDIVFLKTQSNQPFKFNNITILFHIIMHVAVR